MGFGVPAAIGAKIGRPDREVVAIVGDGGFQMTIQELGTILQTGVAVKILVLNNGFLGMVRQWQEMFFEAATRRQPSRTPDFTNIARAYSIDAQARHRSGRTRSRHRRNASSGVVLPPRSGRRQRRERISNGAVGRVRFRNTSEMTASIHAHRTRSTRVERHFTVSVFTESQDRRTEPSRRYAFQTTVTHRKSHQLRVRSGWGCTGTRSSWRLPTIRSGKW